NATGERPGPPVRALLQPGALRRGVGRCIRIAGTRGCIACSYPAFLMLFGCVGGDSRETSTVLASMAAALRVAVHERHERWVGDGFGIGVPERPLGDRAICPPSRTPDGSMLWMSGEAFDWPSRGGLPRATESRLPAFRLRLLKAILSDGAEAVRDLDGEYQI